MLLKGSFKTGYRAEKILLDYIVTADDHEANMDLLLV
jgi:hypothetical protein